jgi:hypothetical protein
MYLYLVSYSTNSLFEGGDYYASDPVAWPFLLRDNK